jgi:hypothetical protein
MKEINNEEIARLMRVTSEPLRRNWEKGMTNGVKLEEVISSREIAIAKQKASKRNSDITLLVLFPLLLLFCGSMVIMSGYGRITATRGFSLVVIAAFVTFLATIRIVFFWFERSNKAWKKIGECEETLAKFQASVDALNPLGIGNIYYDVLTIDVVVIRIVNLAHKVVVAKDCFERLLKPGAIRSDVVHAGQWIDKCDAWFEGIWTAATVDFGIELNKREMFAKAVQQFCERERRRPAHLAK